MPAIADAPSAIVKVALVAFSLAGAVQVVRSAIVQHSVASNPDVAARLWPGNPRVRLAIAMAEIGAAAGKGQAPSATSVSLSESVARRAPLAVEPFLIKGAIAQSEQQAKRAEQLFVEAARRDPRSAAARYFLAQLYLASGRPGEGLRHASVLTRLVTGGPAALVPAIAQYAKSPGAVPNLRRMFAGDPGLRDAVLSDLARDAGNFDLIIALAGGDIGHSDLRPAPAWQGQLLGSLIEGGDVARAHVLWLRISGLRTTPKGLFNPRFAKLSAPAPFNWTFGSGDFGFAESVADGSLQVMYYGRADAQFASQTLLLPPGTYELRARVVRTSDGDGGSGLAWSVACRAGDKTLLNLPIGDVEDAARPIAGRFTVPAGCSSQIIQLAGAPREYARSEQVTISDLKLVRQPR